MFKILLGLSNILNITKENSSRNRGSGCGGRSRGQWFVAAMTVAMVSAVNSGNGNGGDGQRWWKQRQRWGQTTINHKAVAIADQNGDGGGGDGGRYGSGSGNGAAAQWLQQQWRCMRSTLPRQRRRRR